MRMPIIAFRGLKMAKGVFVVGVDKFRILKLFLGGAFFEAEMTKIDIPNPKLIVADDYQQFWVHFECF